MKRPEVAVGAVVIHDGRLLMIERAQPPGAGRWSLPGGRVEGGETLATALAREVREETGVTITVGGLCGIAERIDANYHFVILDFWAVPSPGEAAAADDAADVAWLTSSELTTRPLVDGLHDWLAEHAVLDRLE